ncbi:protein OPAQUE1-like [Typha latifolia]|uniref:protein OPAQUE1-like n=1 Tax=Typha latifolia TaxID=4733 RepID=UPI003C2F41C8
MEFRKGSTVWVEDKQCAWIEADVFDVKDKLVAVITTQGKKITTTPEKLLPRDEDEEHAGVDDMTKLTHLNEPGVLFNLARRYALNEIYTYTGSILIAVNPFTRLPHLYNGHMMEQYKGVRLGELSPHVFAVADASYRAMMNDGCSQSILVSGESGAGKTETTKLLMQYLTYVGGHAAGDYRTVEQQVLESNPLLEAFGNARTVRNDNSSRFGKFVEIHFDRTGRISGAAIRTYLLERSRVVQITDPERNYHCFYQLCASGKDVEKYKLGHPSNFHYLNQSKTYELAGVTSAEEYLKTRRAMNIVGISLVKQEAIFRTLAAILHLGNIEFSPGEGHDSSVIKDAKSNFHLQMASELFMCDISLLLATLCSRTIQTREGSIVKALDYSAAAASRDALAKTVYTRLFDWLVDNINKSVGQDLDSGLQIGVLDIYGFECFKHNSFEQFCINFANEKLQQHFNEHVFKMEQEEYRKEKINWSYIDFIDNQDILDLIEKKPIGIISLLDEACMFPKATHGTFSTKLFQHFRGHPRLEKPKISETNFTLSHYAGKVTYQTDLFLDKNRDYVVQEHCSLLSSSKCSFISELFASPPEEPSRSSYKFSSVASRFKQQLQALMEILNSTEPHYIRCIKPNSQNCPQNFENWSVLHQLKCGGVLEAVRISLAGYPTRRTFSEFIDRFGILAPELTDERFDDKSLTERIIRKLKLDNFQLGRTKVFLRAGQIALLDSRRSEILDSAARIIQDHLRSFMARKEFLITRKSAINLQAYFRGCFVRRIYKVKRQAAAALSVQKYARRWICRRAYLCVQYAVLVIQSNIRGLSVRKRVMHRKKHQAATIIQAKWRMWQIFTFYHQYRQAALSVQCGWRQKLAKRELRMLKFSANEAGALREAKNKLEKSLEDLTLRLTLEKRLRVTVEESKAEEVSKLQKNLESLKAELDAANLETINERNKNVSLQLQLELSMKDQETMRNNLGEMEALNKENNFLKAALETLSKENLEMEQELLKARKRSHDTLDKLQDAETKYLQLQENLQNLEDKLSNLEDENHILRQKALSLSPRKSLGGVVRNLSENSLAASMLTLSDINQKSTLESPTTVKLFPFPQSITESRRSRMSVERHEEYHKLLLSCIREDLGFKNGKPVAACLIYKCLLHWGVFEAERTSTFDYIIEAINSVLKVVSENDVLPYWLANASALLCLLQRNLRSNGFLSVPSRCFPASLIIGGKTSNTIRQETSSSYIDARYPAMLFKQQLTACLEKIFGLIRDNLKKEISPLLSLCIQAPKTTRAAGGRRSRSPDDRFQRPLSTHWDRIIKFLDSLMEQLRKNYVPSFFIRKLVTQVFSFINIQLFNSLLLRRECCTFSNGEYVKSGLAVLEKWIGDATEEYAGAAWDELNYIRQAVGFLVIHQKRKKTLEEIKQNICPALSVRQIYRICTMYCDDKYSTQSISSEVVATMRDLINKDSSNLASNSFLLDDDLSIPFSTEEISKAVAVVDPTDAELPPSLRHIHSAQFLNLH